MARTYTKSHKLRKEARRFFLPHRFITDFHTQHVGTTNTYTRNVATQSSEAYNADMVGFLDSGSEVVPCKLTGIHG
ncbi:hypothetical protein OUZ56_010590 [Daphnia magna]|uniref:Uncharacterized protein n=1 Tax=Daphnia magna TaxID=35525 RepID=A0ABR0AIZ3_9CRUS|nr:hypothetical protein OUZ56_010590 [Daphnia magna]